jgi:hypothetical protein
MVSGVLRVRAGGGREGIEPHLERAAAGFFDGGREGPAL